MRARRKPSPTNDRPVFSDQALPGVGLTDLTLWLRYTLMTFNSAFSTYAVTTSIGPITCAPLFSAGVSFPTDSGSLPVQGITGNATFTASFGSNAGTLGTGAAGRGARRPLRCRPPSPTVLTNCCGHRCRQRARRRSDHGLVSTRCRAGRWRGGRGMGLRPPSALGLGVLDPGHRRVVRALAGSGVAPGARQAAGGGGRRHRYS